MAVCPTGWQKSWQNTFHSVTSTGQAGNWLLIFSGILVKIAEHVGKAFAMHPADKHCASLMQAALLFW